jgi:predicted regulator of Ras-like GTPase activity (Roadblock/LC7/MglB family)
MILYEAEQRQFRQACEQLCQDTLGRAIMMVDVNGQIITMTGRLDGVDTTGMASLIAGTMLASGGLAKQVGEDDFPTHYYEGKRAHLYSVKIGEMLILSVVFDHQSSLGLVRLRVGRALPAFKHLHDKLAQQQSSQPSGSALFAGLDLSDEAIDDMFGEVL